MYELAMNEPIDDHKLVFVVGSAPGILGLSRHLRAIAASFLLPTSRRSHGRSPLAMQKKLPINR
jgi:hypothetical protein